MTSAGGGVAGHAAENSSWITHPRPGGSDGLIQSQENRSWTVSYEVAGSTPARQQRYTTERRVPVVMEGVSYLDLEDGSLEAGARTVTDAGCSYKVQGHKGLANARGPELAVIPVPDLPATRTR